MKINRSKSRKLLFQKLYSLTFNELNQDLFNESFFNNIFTYEIDNIYIDEMLNIILKYENFFIFIIKKFSPKFDVKNMNTIYIIPVFIWLAEMFFLKEEIPQKVSINEAVELSKTYWNDSAKKIVNWLLNKVLENFLELNTLKSNKNLKLDDEKYFKKLL